MPDEMTLGEVNRSLQAVQKSLEGTVVALESGYVKKEFYTEQITRLRKDVDNLGEYILVLTQVRIDIAAIKLMLEGNQDEIDALNEGKKWLTRAVITSVIGALVALLIAVVKLVP